jgi:hypothetical protein
VATPDLNALASCPRVSMDGPSRGNSVEPNAVANPSEVQPKLAKKLQQGRWRECRRKEMPNLRSRYRNIVFWVYQ